MSRVTRSFLLLFAFFIASYIFISSNSIVLAANECTGKGAPAQRWSTGEYVCWGLNTWLCGNDGAVIPVQPICSAQGLTCGEDSQYGTTDLSTVDCQGAIPPSPTYGPSPTPGANGQGCTYEGQPMADGEQYCKDDENMVYCNNGAVQTKQCTTTPSYRCLQESGTSAPNRRATCGDPSLAGGDGSFDLGGVPNYGQANPQPGINCGVPVEKPTPAQNIFNSNTQPVDANKCCYAYVLDYPDLFADPSNFPSLEGMPSFLKGALSSIMGNMLETTSLPGIGTMEEAKQRLRSTPACAEGAPSINGTQTTNLKDPNCKCSLTATGNLNDKICGGVSDSEKAACQQCVGYDAASNKYSFKGVYTALGCLNVIEGGFITSLLTFGTNIGGGIALLCIMYAAFMMQTSQGNPEKIKRSRDLITSCITGLLLIIFSVFILRVIGYDILRIPGLGP